MGTVSAKNRGAGRRCPGGTTMTAAEIVERIASMRYPPDPDPVINAKNAAFLLIVKLAVL